MGRRNIGQCERLALKKAWGNACAYCEKPVDGFEIDHIVAHARGGTCDLENLCVTCLSCNRRKSATPLPKMYEGLLLSLAARKAKKIKAKVEAAIQKAAKPKVATIAKKPKVEQKACRNISAIPGTSFLHELSVDELRDASKLITLILNMGITKRHQVRFPPSLPDRVYFESARVLPHGIKNPERLLASFAYFGKRPDGDRAGSPCLVPKAFKYIETGELQFEFITPRKELQKLKKGISNFLNQTKEAA